MPLRSSHSKSSTAARGRAPIDAVPDVATTINAMPPEFVLQSFADGLRPDPLETVTEWADGHRVLSRVSAGEPGQWRTERTPYLREIMDCLSPASPIETVVFEKAAQIGGTEILLNFLGFIFHRSPGPTLLVLPTTELAQRFSKQRLASLIETTPELRDLVTSAEHAGGSQRTATILTKQFAGGVLIATGANSSVGLRSMPARFVVCDEVDTYPASVAAAAGGNANAEGDPLALAIERTNTFANRKILLISTPSTKGLSRIDAAYAESDQRQYFVPCPACGEFQVLTWSNVKWPEGNPKAATYECLHCQARIGHHEKTGMLSRGEWRATAESDGKTAGFHISALYSPWLSWCEIAARFLKARKSPERLRAWTNNSLAECWDDPAEQRVEAQSLLVRCEPYGPDLPAGVALLTCGCDVQANRIVLELVGWGLDEESWSIAHHVILGDPTRPEVWASLEEILTRQYRHVSGLTLPIACACIDSGHRAAEVYSFTRTRFERRVYAVKGTLSGPIWPRKPSAGMDRAPLFIVGTDAAKTAVYARLRIDTPGPGYCHFPLRPEYGIEFFEELTAERPQVRYSKGFPHREWFLPAGARNEGLDTRAYNLAALHACYASGLKLNEYAARMAEAAKHVVAQPDAVKPVAASATTPRIAAEDRREPWIDRNRTKNWLRER